MSYYNCCRYFEISMFIHTLKLEQLLDPLLDHFVIH